MISLCCVPVVWALKGFALFLCVLQNRILGTGGESVCVKVTLADADLRVLALSHMCATDLAHAHVKRKKKQQNNRGPLDDGTRSVSVFGFVQSAFAAELDST